MFQVVIGIFVSIWVGGVIEIGLDALQKTFTIAPPGSGAIGKWSVVVVEHPQ